MAPTNFPGRPAAKCSAKKRRISAKKLQFKPEKLLVIERTAAFLNDFYNVFGESDDEEEDFHGFSSRELDRSRTLSKQLQAQADSFREELWLARGVILDQRNREAIKERANKALSRSNTSSPHTASNPSTSSRSSKHIKPPVMKPPGTTKPRLEKSPERPAEPRRPKVQILVPSFRLVDSKGEGGRGEARPRKQDIEEDLSDQAYVTRHTKAEEEEQEMWDSWQKLRKSNFQLRGGRSKSRRWREVALPAGLRAHRVSSVQSEDSFSGRLSPRSGQLTEIQIVTAPPTPLPEEAASPPATSTPAVLSFTPHAVSPHKYSSDILPPSPPMSPNNSPKSRRKASDTSRRTRSNINVEASPSSLKENLSEEKVDKSTIGPDKPRLVGSKVLRDQCNAATKRRNTGSHGRSPQIGLVKRLNSPKKSQAVSREVYPLRNQQLSRRTRQGSRR